MAQGKLKTKVKLPKGVKKSNNQKKNKPLNLKKGGGFIAPKKERQIEQNRIAKVINKRIERDIQLKAASQEPSAFTVVKVPKEAKEAKK